MARLFQCQNQIEIWICNFTTLVHLLPRICMAAMQSNMIIHTKNTPNPPSLKHARIHPKKWTNVDHVRQLSACCFCGSCCCCCCCCCCCFGCCVKVHCFRFFERERFQHLHIRYCIVLASEASPRSSAVYVPFSCHQSDLTLLDPAGSCGRNLIISWNFAFSTFSCILVTFHDNICALTTFDMTTLTEQESGVVLFRLHCAPQGWHVPACPWTSVDSIRRQVENVEILQTPQLKN